VVGLGTEIVYIDGYDTDGWEVFSAEIRFTVTVNMDQVTIRQSSITAYMIPEYDGEGTAYYDGTTAALDLVSTETLPSGTSVSVKSSNSNYSVYASLTGNKIDLDIYGSKAGNTVLTITIEGKEFTVKAKLVRVGISKTSLLLGKNKTSKLKITGYSGRITWKSKNKSIATVSSNGTVKGKKYGNTVIIAKVGNQYLGCAVSVTTPSLVKVCARAEYIGRNWTYSQAKRTKKGYYDCSSLVWKAYKQYTKINFGSSSYPGTTSTESAWCKKKKRVLKGQYQLSMVYNMQLRPGDIVFKSNSKKNKYSTVYHVEMFTGYTCTSVDSSGNPTIESRWGSRGSGYQYGISNGYIVARPMKY
jgi:cell wall-associated NlpC family hydrolase